MNQATAQKTEFTLKLNNEERQELRQLLQHAFEETRVELHHTHTPSFRDQVLGQEQLFRGLINKLGQA
jgi:hypothetical protein